MRSSLSKRTLGVLLVILLGAGGCRGESGPPADEILADDPADGIELQFGIQEATYSPGDTIRAVIRVVNRGSEARILEFSSSQRFDILLLDAAEESVHSWSADKSFAQAIEEETLEPGGDLEYEATIVAPDAPGGYSLRGVITATGADLESTLPIVVDG